MTPASTSTPVTETAGTTTTYADHSAPLWRRLLLTREMAIIALTAALVAYAWLGVENFAGPLTVKYLLQDVAPILLIALPMTLVIVTGEIDLSVASVMGLSSVVVGFLFSHGVGMGVAVLAALVVGVLCGALNGFLVAYLQLPSLAVTIGTLALFRGIAVGLLGTTAVTNFPEGWRELGTGTIGESPIPLVMIPFVLLAIAFSLLLHFSTFGRGVYDIGLNKEAAHFSGVNVARTKFLLFVLCGAVAGLAGIYFTLRFGTSRGDNATGLELQVIAAVLLGGVSIFGGTGRLHGVLAGVVLIGVVASALRLEQINVNATNIIIGLLLIASVVVPQVIAAVRTRRGPRKTSRPNPGAQHGSAAAGV